MGRKRGRRGQRKGQIYFLRTMDLDDGPLWGHRGAPAIRISSREKAKRSARTFLQAAVCVYVCAYICMCERLESWSPSPRRSPALFHFFCGGGGGWG